MTHLVDLGIRIELVSMDRFCADITIGLYRALDPGGRAHATVHTYSAMPGASERAAWLARAMIVLGGLEPAGDDPRAVRFACPDWHELAIRRVFLEAAKLDPSTPLQPRPLWIEDRKSGQRITATSAGLGAYLIGSEGGDPGAPSRAPIVGAGLTKLAELAADPDDPTRVTFGCGTAHDALVGLLLPRAINVRSAIQEAMLAASKGILVAPSQQAAQP